MSGLRERDRERERETERERERERQTEREKERERDGRRNRRRIGFCQFNFIWEFTTPPQICQCLGVGETVAAAQQKGV
jgi:hypothetical protein